MSNIQTVQIHVEPATIQNIFSKYKIMSEYPIDYKKFVEDVIKSTTAITTTAYIPDAATKFTFSN